MSANIIPGEMQHFFCEQYNAEWKLTKLIKNLGKKMVSPPFSPLSNVDIKFCFEVWFLKCSSLTYNTSNENVLFKFILIKLDDSPVPASLKLETEMKVQHSDGTLIKEYRDLPAVTIKEMESYYFDEIHLQYKCEDSRSCRQYFTDVGERLNRNEPILVKCRMKFLSCLDDFPANVLPALVCDIKSLEASSEDIKYLKRSDEFSDIIVRVGHKLFLAHKSVLAHHSSVLKQMIDDNNETILITGDDSSDAFECLLDYLYSDKLKTRHESMPREDTPWPLIKDLYVLSAKYKVDALKTTCAAEIISYMSVDKVCDILKVAYDYEDANLKLPAITFAMENIRDIISSNAFKELIVSHPLIGYEITVYSVK